MRNRKLRSALRAIGHGFAVLLLNWAVDGLCSCGDPHCSSVGKHPLTSHGVHDATKDESIIRDLLDKYPKANIAIATGKASGVIVVDVDPRNGGAESLQQFEEENGPLPEGPVVETGGGGSHLYFEYSQGVIGNKTGLLPGIDVKSDRGYVVYPGSEHASGKRYLWLNGKSPRKVDAPPFPASLLKLTTVRRSTVAAPSKSDIPQGLRNTTLTSMAGVMRRRNMSQQSIEAALLQENSLRCDPPLPDSEVCSIARSIGRYAPGEVGIVSSASSNVEKAERKLKFRTGKQIAEETPVAVPWIVPRWVVMGGITEMDGKIKLGKTTFATYMVYCVLNGLPFLGEATSRTRVLYLTEQHIVSFRAAMGRANLLGCKDFTVLSWTDTLGIPWPTVVSTAIDECKKRKAALLIIDTLGQFSGLTGDSENNAGDALKALRPIQQAAKEDIAVVFIRHERKSGGAVGDSGRGSSAFSGAADIVMSVRKPEGNHGQNVRLIQTLSRFDATDDLLVELTPQGYQALGSPGEEAKQRAADHVLNAIPKSRKHAVTIDDLAKAIGQKRAHLQTLLDVLGKTKKTSKLGTGRRGDPYRYFRL